MADRQHGPIAITGASGQVGTLLRERLADAPNEFRALDQGDDWAAAIRGAQAVVHLAGTLQPKGDNTYEAANVTTTETVASAASDAHVDRIVFLSYLGADPGSSNAYLASPAGTFDLAGPDRMSMDELVRRVNGGEVRMRHLPGTVARLLARLSPVLTPALIDLLVRDNVPPGDPGETAARFGVTLHRFPEVWAPT